MKCPRCGSESLGKFCSECGASLQAKRYPDTLLIIIGAVGFMFLLVMTSIVKNIVKEKIRTQGSAVGGEKIVVQKPLLHEEEPREVIEKFLGALRKSDVATAETYFTEAYKRQTILGMPAHQVVWFSGGEMGGLGLGGREFDAGGFYKYEIGESSIVGNTARVTATTYRRIRLRPSVWSGPPPEGHIEIKRNKWRAVLYKTTEGWKIGSHPEDLGTDYLKSE